MVQKKIDHCSGLINLSLQRIERDFESKTDGLLAFLLFAHALHEVGLPDRKELQSFPNAGPRYLEDAIHDLRHLIEVENRQLSKQISHPVLWELLDTWRGGEDLSKTGQVVHPVFWHALGESAGGKGLGFNTFTPWEIVELISYGLEFERVKSVYDPCMGGGSLFAGIRRFLSPDVFARGKAITSFDQLLARFRMLRYSNPHFDSDDTSFMPFGKRQKLAEPDGKWTLKPDEVFLGSIDRTDRYGHKFDLIVSHPIFGYRMDEEWPEGGYFSGGFHSTRSEIRYLTHILDHLSEDGVAAVIQPAGTLFSGGRTQGLRAEMIKKNVLEAVVCLPRGIFFQTGVETVVFFLSRRKKHNKVLLIDAMEEGKKHGYRRVLPEGVVNQIIQTLHAFRATEPLPYSKSRVVGPAELEKQDFVLDYHRYAPKESIVPNGLQSSRKLLKECEKLEREVGVIQRRFWDLENGG